MAAYVCAAHSAGPLLLGVSVLGDNGPYTLGMTAGINNKLPFGVIPRLLLAWVCTEAVRTQSRDLVLGRSLSEFMRKLGVYSTSGGGPAVEGNLGPGRHRDGAAAQAFPRGRGGGFEQLLGLGQSQPVAGPHARTAGASDASDSSRRYRIGRLARRWCRISGAPKAR